MDYAFLKSNPLYVVIAFLVFYFIIAQPFLNLTVFQSIVLFIVLYVLFKKYGGNFSDKFKSAFGSRRRH
jgi:hypothetical protein